MWYFLSQYVPGFSDISKVEAMVSLSFLAVLWILNIVAFWRVFEKAGEKGWKSLIPIYNIYIMFKVAWSPKAFLNVVLISFIVIIDEWQLPTSEGIFQILLYVSLIAASIYSVVIMLQMSIRMSKAFGHGVPFGLGLYFLEVPFIMILGLGKSVYVRPAPDLRFEEANKL